MHLRDSQRINKIKLLYPKGKINHRQYGDTHKLNDRIEVEENRA